MKFNTEKALIFSGMYEGREIYQIDIGGAYATCVYEGIRESRNDFFDKVADKFVNWIKSTEDAIVVETRPGRMKVNTNGQTSEVEIEKVDTRLLVSKLVAKMSQFNDEGLINVPEPRN